MLTPNSCLASIDLKDEYYCILLQKNIRNTLNSNGIINCTNSLLVQTGCIWAHVYFANF